MTMIDNGVQGAKRQAMHHDALLKLCQGVLNDRPANMDPVGPAMIKRFKAALDDNDEREEMLATILEYFWLNTVKRITKKPPTAAERAQAERDRIAQRQAATHEMAMKLDAKVNEMFLDMIMSNGKTLRSCTKRELIVLRPKENKVIDGIIRTLKRASDVVGSVFKTNQELERFWKKKS